MTTRKWTTMLVVGLSLCSIAVAAFTLVQQGNVWTVDMDSAGHKGTQTTTVTVSYTDTNGKKQTKSIAATTDIPANTSATQKKALVQAKLDAAIADSANQVGGQSLAATGGLGDTI